MSLIFAESFDGFLINPSYHPMFSGKWHNQSSSNAGATVTGRYGNGWTILNTTGANSFLYRYLAAAEQDDLLIVGMAIKFSTSTSSSFGGPVLQLFNDASLTSVGNTQLYISWRGDLSRLDTYRGAGSVLLGSSTTITKDTWHYFEFKCRLHSTSGTVEIRQNGASIFSYGGQTKHSGTANTFSCVGFGNLYFSTGQATNVVDDLYVCNEQGTVNNDYLGDIRVEALTPNGDGAHTDLAPFNLNRLPNTNVSGAETNASGWTTEPSGTGGATANSTVARVTTPLHAGLGSTGALQVTASGAGIVVVKTLTGTSGAPVRSGQVYYPAVYARANTTGRNLQLGIEWYDSAGAFLAKTAMTATSADNNTAYGQKTGSALTAPTYAAFASLVVQIDSVANGEVHFLDDAYISEAQVITDPGANPSAAHYLAVSDLATAMTGANGSDASYLVGTNNDDMDTWTFTDPQSPAGKVVKGVVVFATARQDALSSKSLALVARNPEGVEATSGDQPLAAQFWTTALTGVSAGFDLNPDGTTWTVPEIAGSEFGVKVRP